MRDLEEALEDRFYIMTEGEMLCDCSSFSQAMFLQLAVHYVFNLQYDPTVYEPLLFLQEFVANVDDKFAKHSASFVSISSAISRNI